MAFSHSPQRWGISAENASPVHILRNGNGAGRVTYGVPLVGRPEYEVGRGTGRGRLGASRPVLEPNSGSEPACILRGAGERCDGNPTVPARAGTTGHRSPAPSTGGVALSLGRCEWQGGCRQGAFRGVDTGPVGQAGRRWLCHAGRVWSAHRDENRAADRCRCGADPSPGFRSCETCRERGRLTRQRNRLLNRAARNHGIEPPREPGRRLALEHALELAVRRARRSCRRAERRQRHRARTIQAICAIECAGEATGVLGRYPLKVPVVSRWWRRSIPGR